LAFFLTIEHAHKRFILTVEYLTALSELTPIAPRPFETMKYLWAHAALMRNIGLASFVTATSVVEQLLIVIRPFHDRARERHRSVRDQGADADRRCPDLFDMAVFSAEPASLGNRQ